MSDYFKNLQLETFLVEVVYLTTGAIATAWFQSMTIYPFWGYETSFIDLYKENSFIYTVLFFGFSYATSLFLREVGIKTYNYVCYCFSNVGLFSKDFLLAHFDKGYFSITNEVLITKLETKPNKNYYYFDFQRRRARMIGHRILLGFFTINFLITLYGYAQHKNSFTLLIIFFIIILCSCSYVSKSTQHLYKFLKDL